MSVSHIKVKVANGRGAEAFVTISWQQLERDIEGYSSQCVGKSALRDFLNTSGITTTRDPRFEAWKATWHRCQDPGCKLEVDGECAQGWPSRVVAAEIAERRPARRGA